MILNEKEHPSQVIGKGRIKQKKKCGGLAILIRKEWRIECELMDVGDSEMSKDIMIARFEYNERGHRANLYVCLCYMTVEGNNAHKYDILARFINKYENKILVVGDMNGHIGLLGENENGNGKLLREK